MKNRIPYIPISTAYHTYMHVTVRSISPEMKTVFNARHYGGFTEIKSNLKRKKDRTNQSFNFLIDFLAKETI